MSSNSARAGAAANRQVSYSEARQAAVENACSAWRGRNGPNRIEPECWPDLKPRFQFARGSTIYTTGSCFARNIEIYLEKAGFDVPTLRYSSSDDQEPSRTERETLNRYSPAAIFQEIAWAHRIYRRDDLVQPEDIEPLLYRLPDGRCIDLQTGHIQPGEYRWILARRKRIYDVVRTAFNADVVIMTLGMIEIWRDRATGLAIQQTPGVQGRSFRKEDLERRFAFEQLNFSDVHRYLTGTIDLLESTGPKKILITTSPVPLTRTFTRDDVIVATMYGKSVLRAASGQVVTERENVDYFPSYESVMLTRQPYVWDDDLQHVSDAFVGRIVGRVCAAYAPAPTVVNTPSDQALKVVGLVKRERHEEAAEHYRALENADVDSAEFHACGAEISRRRGDIEKALYHASRALDSSLQDAELAYSLYVTCATLKAEELSRRAFEQAALSATRWTKNANDLYCYLHGKASPDVALRLFRRMAELSPNDGNISRLLGILLGSAGSLVESERFLRRACDLDPDQGWNHYQLAIALMRLGRDADSVTAIERAVSLDPLEPHFRFELAKALGKTGRAEEGELHLEAAIQAEPSMPQGYYLLAMHYRDSGRRDAALGYAQRAVALRPDSAAYREMLKSISGPA